MLIVAGIILHFIGGFASGSFYIPYKKVSGWSWESFWLVGGLFSWLIVPPLVAWVTIPGFAEIIHNTPPTTIAITYVMGTLWGVGGLTYGLGVRHLGVALGSSIILGLCAVLGALVPSVYYQLFPSPGHETVLVFVTTRWGAVILLGIIVCILGITVCGIAGKQKETQLSKQHVEKNAFSSYDFKKGILLALASGALSACFNFGLEAGKNMAMTANAVWIETHPGNASFLFRNNVVYVVILWGGLTTNLIWCIFLNIRNKSKGDYIKRSAPLLKNYLFCALAGTMWFLQFFFYGMGESRLGNNSSSWVLHMAFIILIANLWGIILKEWKQASRSTFRLLLGGIALILISVAIVGLGNSLKT